MSTSLRDLQPLILKDHQKNFDFLKKKYEEGQVAHAYLFSGPKAEDINSFTKEFAKYVHCLSKSKKPCQTCSYCTMIEKGNFPDVILVKSAQSASSLKNEKDMMEISVEQMRSVENFLSFKAYYPGFKIVIIEDASRMTFEAQSCFLKTLEEPKGKSIIFLISSKANTLLPTIFSRCQELKFLYTGIHDISPKEELLLENLLAVLPSDLAAKFNYAKKINLEENNFNTILELLLRCLRDTLLTKIGVIKTIKKNIFEHYSISKITKIMKLIENIHQQGETGNINNKLALEIILLEL